MCAENIHQDPDFQEKKRAYFQNFMLRHLPETREFKKNGLLVEKGSEKWKNVARHQLLSAVMTETVSELMGRPLEVTKQLTNDSLIHDVTKRREQEKMSPEEVIAFESRKNERPIVATSSNFTGFGEWGIDEYTLRYVDSSVGNNPKDEGAGHWYGASKVEKLPEVLILPWRDRIQMFKENKIKEGEMGRTLYGMTTWEKLEEIMTIVESDLYKRIIKKNPELAEKYDEPSKLTQLIEDKIHEKILG